MSATQVFVLINIIGGISVLGGYLIGLINYPDLRMSLWGGIEGGWRTIFSISMIPAAIGYLAFCYYMVFESGLERFDHNVILLRYLPSILCAVFLVSASVWMPATLSNLYVNVVVWLHISTTAFWITAISFLILTASLICFYPGGQSLSRIIGTAGLLYITFHCTVFDAIIWISRFPKVP